MKKIIMIFTVLILAGCSTLRVGDVSYNSFLSTTDTLTITRPDGSKINMKGKTTLDPTTIQSILSGAVK